MKKFGILFLGLVIVGVVLYALLSDSHDVEVDSTMEAAPQDRKVTVQKNTPRPEVTATPSPVVRKEVDEQEEKEEGRPPKFYGTAQKVYDEEALNEEEVAKLDAYFTEVEGNWNKTMKSFMEEELGLSEEDFNTYKGLKSGFERDKMEAFDAFHEQMQEKHGEHYSYSPTEDEEAFSAKINEDYLLRIQKLLGDEGFKRYLQLKDTYNEELKKNQDPKHGYLIMDL